MGLSLIGRIRLLLGPSWGFLGPSWGSLSPPRGHGKLFWASSGGGSWPSWAPEEASSAAAHPRQTHRKQGHAERTIAPRPARYHTRTVWESSWAPDCPRLPPSSLQGPRCGPKQLQNIANAPMINAPNPKTATMRRRKKNMRCPTTLFNLFAVCLPWPCLSKRRNRNRVERAVLGDGPRGPQDGPTRPYDSPQ